jgi:preprotein translocase subunit SecD
MREIHQPMVTKRYEESHLKDEVLDTPRKRLDAMIVKAAERKRQALSNPVVETVKEEPPTNEETLVEKETVVTAVEIVETTKEPIPVRNMVLINRIAVSRYVVEPRVQDCTPYPPYPPKLFKFSGDEPPPVQW